MCRWRGFGCTDENALNFNIDATEDDDSCYYTIEYDLLLHTGANLVSFYALPENTDVSSMFSSVFSSTLGVLGEGYAAYNLNDTWIGALLSIDAASGYWLIMNNDETLTVDGYPMSSSFEYSLHQGANLVSFPDAGSFLIEDVIPEELQGVIYDIIGEGNYATYTDEGWVGSLESLQGGKGYWMKSYEDIEMTFNIDSNLSRNYEDENFVLDNYMPIASSEQAFYRIDDIEGYDDGDWLLSYNKNTLVGSSPIIDGISDIAVMGDDGFYYSYNYCKEGDLPKFKLYKYKTGEILDLYGSYNRWSSNEISNISFLRGENLAVPAKFGLTNIYPNPFNPTATIDFSLNENMHVSLTVYDLKGRVVNTLIDQFSHAGSYSINFNGDNLSSGVYFVELRSGSLIEYSKIILLK